MLTDTFKHHFDDPIKDYILGYYLAYKLSTSDRNALMANTDYPYLQGLDPAPDTDDKKNYQLAYHYAGRDLLDQTTWDNTLTALLAEGDRIANNIIVKAVELRQN